MKIIVFALITLLYTIPTYAEGTIKLAYSEFPPYVYTDKVKKKTKGSLTRIVKKIFKKAGISYSLRAYPYVRACKLVEQGKVDGFFNMFKTKDVIDKYDFSSPIMKSAIMLVVKKGSPIKFNSLEDLKGLKLGVLRGCKYGDKFDDSKLFLRDPAYSHIINLRKVIAGRIDAYPCEAFVFIKLASKEGLLPELELIQNPVSEMKGYIVFTKGVHKETIDKINIHLKELVP